MLSLGYLYFVIFFCLIRLDIKVSTPTRPINIRTMTISLLSLPKVGVRSRLEPTVLSAEVHSKTNAITEACGSRMLKTEDTRENNQQIKNQCGIRTPDGIMR